MNSIQVTKQEPINLPNDDSKNSASISESATPAAYILQGKLSSEKLWSTVTLPDDEKICIYCRMVRHNLKEKVWVRVDNSVTDDQKQYPIEWPTESLEELQGNVLPIDVPYENTENKLEQGKKPNGIWFSAGSWLYNHGFNAEAEYHDCRKFEISEHKEDSVLVAINPSNILYIQNKENLDEFISKYSSTTFDPKQWNETNKQETIDWTKVCDDGYYGIAFTFWSIVALGLQDSNPKYCWHSGYDVESLVVWNQNAYKRQLYHVKLKI